MHHVWLYPSNDRGRRGGGRVPDHLAADPEAGAHLQSPEHVPFLAHRHRLHLPARSGLTWELE